MSSANRTIIDVIKEGANTYGQTPSVGHPTRLWWNSESLAQNQETQESPIITSDRDYHDLIDLGSTTGGEINAFMSYGASDIFIEGLLGTDFSAASEKAATEITAAGVVSAAAHGFSVGDLVDIKGFGKAANNGTFRITAKTANNFTVDNVNAAAEVHAATATLPAFSTSGFTRNSFTVQKEFPEVSAFHVYKGMVVGSMAVAVSPTSPITADVTMAGATHDVASVSQLPGNAARAAYAGTMVGGRRAKVLDTVNLGATPHIMSMDITLDNQVRQNREVGKANPFEARFSRLRVTGNLNLYFQDRALYESFVNQLDAGLTIELNDSRPGQAVGTYNRYIVDMPRMRLSTGTVLATGVDADVMASFTFQTLYKPEYEFSLRWYRIPKTP